MDEIVLVSDHSNDVIACFTQGFGEIGLW